MPWTPHCKRRALSSSFLLTFLVLALAAAACSSSAPTSSPEDPDPTSEPTEPTEPAEPTEVQEPTQPPTPEPTPTPKSVMPQALAVCDAVSAQLGVSVADEALSELSGLAFSSVAPDVLWGHNDSGSGPEVFAIDVTTGATIGTIEFDEIDAVDWEDLAIGPGPGDQPYLYIADFGDNAGARESVVIYRTLEPGVAGGGVVRSGPVDTIELFYPGRIADAEALLVDPIRGDLVIVTKRFGGGPAEILFVPAPPAGNSSVVMQEMTTVDFQDLPVNSLAKQIEGGLAVTGGDVVPNGDVVIIRTYASIVAFPREPGTALWEALTNPACEAPSQVEQQGEAIALSDTRYITISEGKNPVINQFDYTRDAG